MTLRPFVKALAIALLAMVLFGRCTKPTFVGSELVDIDGSPLFREDTFTVVSRSVILDSFPTYSRTAGTRMGRFPLGFVEDAYFGTSRSTFYFEVVPSYGFSEPDFQGAVLDSLVLTIAADTSFVTGSPLATVPLRVYRLQDTMPRVDLFSNRSLPLQPGAIGTHEGGAWPIPQYSSVEYGTSTIDTISRSGFRIHLDPALGQEIMAMDSSTLVSDSLFKDRLKGFALRFDQPNGGFVGLRYADSHTRLTLYYRVQDTVRRQAIWTPYSPPQALNASHLHFDIDRSKAKFPQLLSQNTTQDTVHFIQGMAGSDLEIDLPFLPLQDRVLVNHALLEVTVCPLDGEAAGVLGPPDQLDMYYLNDQGNAVVIDDVSFALTNGSFGLANYFGGVPRTDTATGLTTYTFNLSAIVQKIIDGRFSPPIYARVYNRQNSPKRMTVCGSSGSHPPRLTITYSRLNP